MQRPSRPVRFCNSSHSMLERPTAAAFPQRSPGGDQARGRLLRHRLHHPTTLSRAQKRPGRTTEQYVAAAAGKKDTQKCAELNHIDVSGLIGACGTSKPRLITQSSERGLLRAGKTFGEVQVDSLGRAPKQRCPPQALSTTTLRQLAARLPPVRRVPADDPVANEVLSH
jgi:hypothetical protein